MYYLKSAAALILFLLLNSPTGVSAIKADEFDHDHTLFNEVLGEVVHDGHVDYGGLKDSVFLLDEYIKKLSGVTTEQYERWTAKQKLAFWINAYNAFTLKVITDNYPITRSWTLIGIFYAPSNSILQIPGVWTDIKFEAAGRSVTLDHIEHEIIRKKFDEPRIHAAINCASISCPDLRGESYTSERLDYQLDQASYEFVNDEKKGFRIVRGEAEHDSQVSGFYRVSDKPGEIKISRIFRWFGEDFEGHYDDEGHFENRPPSLRGVLGYITKYIESDKKREFLKNNRYRVSYLGYDWGLNDIDH